MPFVWPNRRRRGEFHGRETMGGIKWERGSPAKSTEYQNSKNVVSISCYETRLDT